MINPNAHPALLRFTDGALGGEEPSGEALNVDLDRLVRTRLLIQAESGGGKSWMIRYLLEQTHGRLPHLLLDLEGEFASLREQFPYVLVSATEGEGDLPAHPDTARTLCRRLAELGASAILDLFDLDAPDQQRFVRLFLEELLSLPRPMWSPRLVVVDEADRLAPERGNADSAAAVNSLVKRGRKRGLGAVLAVQRLSDLDKGAAGGLQNKLVGLTTLDTDVRRVADDLGFSKEARAALKELAPGDFFAFGPAIPVKGVVLVRSGDVSTTHEHDEEAEQLPPPPGELSEVLKKLAASLESDKVDGEAAEGDSRRRGERGQDETAQVQTDEVVARLEEKVERLERNAEELAGKCSWLEGENARLRSALGEAERLARNLLGVLSDAPVASSEPAEPKEAKPEEVPSPDPPGDLGRPPSPPANGRLKQGARYRILAALRDLEALNVSSLPRNNLAVFADQGPRSSAFRDHLAALKDEALVSYPSPGTVALTAKGRAAISEPRPGAASSKGAERAPRSLQDLHAAWRRRLPPASAAILSVLVDHHPGELSREQLAEGSGQSPRSSAFRDRLADLRSLGLVEYPKSGYVRVSKLLFPEALPPDERTEP